MSPLQQRMLEDMQLRKFSAGTQRSYIHYVTGYATYFDLNPARLGLDDIRNYQLHLIEQRQLSPEFHQLFPLRSTVSLHRNAGHAVVQAAVRTDESPRKIACCS